MILSARSVPNTRAQKSSVFGPHGVRGEAICARASEFHLQRLATNGGKGGRKGWRSGVRKNRPGGVVNLAQRKAKNADAFRMKLN
jgi:hypothetical protein